jgi:hypothetical protein
MMLLDRRFRGMPVAFLAVLVATVLLTIFLGAWAVSADVQDPGRSLSFGVGATGPDPASIASDTPKDESRQGSAPETEDRKSAADSWWGSAFLKACPLH